jgi:hypothetical protein
MRIMRKENWLVALLNNEVLPLSLPLPAWPWAPRGAAPQRTRPLLPQTLEWSLSLTLLDVMYDGQLKLRRDFLTDPAALRRRFVLAGLVNLALLPFVAVFMAVFFFLRHADELHRTPGSIGAREFTPHARWCMREYNELTHVFEERTRGAYDDAARYVGAFPRRELAIVSRLVTFVFGSLAGVAIAISVLNQEVLIHYRAPQPLGGHNLLWYLALASGALAISRAFAIEPEADAPPPEHWLRRVCARTHCGLAKWEGRAHTAAVRAAFCARFEYKLVTLLAEICSCVTTPYVLCVALPPHAEAIVDFIARTRVCVDGLGDVCACATFALPPAQTLAADEAEGAGRAASEAALAANRGLKLQRSLLSFAAHHPSWAHAQQQAQQQQTPGAGSADGLAQSNLLLAALDQHRQGQHVQPPPHGMRSTSLQGAHGYGYGYGYGCGSMGGGGYGGASSFLGQPGGGQIGSSGRSLVMAGAANLDAVSERGGADGEHALAESEPRWAAAAAAPRVVVAALGGEGSALALRGEAEQLRELEALEREEAAHGGGEALARSEAFAARRGQLVAHLLNAQLDSAAREGGAGRY